MTVGGKGALKEGEEKPKVVETPQAKKFKR